jgi:hypothetical protein
MALTGVVDSVTGVQRPFSPFCLFHKDHAMHCQRHAGRAAGREQQHPVPAVIVLVCCLTRKAHVSVPYVCFYCTLCG